MLFNFCPIIFLLVKKLTLFEAQITFLQKGAWVQLPCYYLAITYYLLFGCTTIYSKSFQFHCTWETQCYQTLILERLILLFFFINRNIIITLAKLTNKIFCNKHCVKMLDVNTLRKNSRQ